MVAFWEEHQAGNEIAALKAKLATRPGCCAMESGSTPRRASGAGRRHPLAAGRHCSGGCASVGGDRCEVDQSALTGESLPATRKPGEAVFSGRLSGRAKSTRWSTPPVRNTYFGKTAELVQEAHTVSHFQRAVLKIGDYLIVLAVALVALIVTVALFRHDPVLSTLEFALVLLVAAIPVAMPTVLSVTMAVGARLLAKKQAIVTRLVGDRGTRRRGRAVLGQDRHPDPEQTDAGRSIRVNGITADQVILWAALASRAEDKDTIDLAVIGGVKDDKALKSYQVAPFPAVRSGPQAHGSTVKGADGKQFYVAKGAPQVILQMSTNAGEVKPAVEKAVNEFAGRGFRSLGVARADQEDKWQFVGVLPMFDPPREQAKATIASARQMGVNVKMVTGDQMAIARETAKQLGMGTNILDASDWATPNITRRRRRPRPSKRRTASPRYFPNTSTTLSSPAEARPHRRYDRRRRERRARAEESRLRHRGFRRDRRGARGGIHRAVGVRPIRDHRRDQGEPPIFQRMNSYAIYRIAETLRVLLFMTLAILVFNFYPVTAVMIVMIALLNDGAILSIAYDNVHYKDKPEAWNMRLVLGISTVLGVIGVVAAFGLFYLGERVFHLDRAHVQTLMYLKLSVAGHLTIFLTRTRGPFWSIRPARILWIAVLGTQTWRLSLRFTGCS